MEGKPDRKILELVTDTLQRVRSEVGRVIIGQKEVIDLMLTAILSKGHSILIGVPGVAKTLIVNTIAKVLSLSFSRIQFTPDLMPADITGTDVLEEEEGGRKLFRFVKGPVFANILLADEINRTPPKTQSALLQAMQELKVTVGGRTYLLEEPFIVFATQNPIELEGTYPLPEAQLDRFMMRIDIHYPSEREEIEIADFTTKESMPEPRTIVAREELLELQRITRSVPVAESVVEFAVKIVRMTRPEEANVPVSVKENVDWGAGPRGSQFLVLGAKAQALMEGRPSPTTDDVISIASPVLKHRLILNYRAKARGITPDEIISDVIERAKS